MKLFNRADGIKEHYCIGRHVLDTNNNPTIYYEFWNEHLQQWCSAGTVYYSKDEAKKAKLSLEDPL